MKIFLKMVWVQLMYLIEMVSEFSQDSPTLFLILKAKTQPDILAQIKNHLKED
jgi:hypothetical protein